MQSMDIDVDEVSYVRTTHPLFIKKSIQNLRKALLPMNASVIFVHKQLDIELVRGALGNNIKIVGIIHGFNAKHIEHADVLIAVSDKVKEFLIDSGCTKPIYVVPNMVKIGNDIVYRDLPTTPLIGAMGMFRRKKGFHILIKALSILKQRGVSFKAIIAGKGRITWYLQYLRWKLDLKNELTMRGWISNDERDEFVDSIDLYILPSRTETFGMVVVEAMARMKRVIATKCGGPEEIITDGVDGFLVDKENPEAVADKLEELIYYPERSNHVPEAAFNTAKSNYSLPAVSSNLKEIISSL
jgi:glycosyltransferase involved in cell wall biosynthesis